MKILIVDDHQLFLEGLSYLLSSYKPVLDIFEARNTKEALQKFSDQEFDLVLLDLSMPGLDGISCLGSLQKIRPSIPIAIISAMEDSELVIGALRLGAVGFIPKSYTQLQMFDALDKLISGDVFIPEEVHWHLSRKLDLDSDDSVNLKLVSLNIREKQFAVLKLVADSLTVQEIGECLSISPNTVKSHIKKLYQCLHVSSRLEVVTEARRLGLLA